MKKHIVLAMALMAVMSLNAQEVAYTLKLDSVVGSNDFDWTRWKNVYTYHEEGRNILVTEVIRYEWENQAWMPVEKTERRSAASLPYQEETFQWTGERWVSYQMTYTHYDEVDPQLKQSVVTYRTNDTVFEGWTGLNSTRYEYDPSGHLTLVMNCVGTDTLDQWMESSKYEYSYNADGLLDTCVFSTIRNGNWNASQREFYTYNDDRQCIRLLAQRKGGWGPSANQWRDSYRYDFEYENGELESEYFYIAMGWFGGGEMGLDSKWEYEYDANGNLLRKTGSVYNEEDWIVRDVYENRFDASVEASKVLGLEGYWQSVVDEGMGYTLGAAMPLASQWLSCSIITTNRDTEFTLYCSGFAGVEEEQVTSLKAWVHQGLLTVTCEEFADITVFDLLGRKVASEMQTQQCAFNLTPGLYIVSNGNARIKVIVD